MDSISVVISSPTHSPHKFTLDLSRQCSILELKEIIVTRLDTKLTIADQRLIYGGRILDDKDTLERVFEKVDCSSISPTIHLAVSHRHDPGQAQQQSSTIPSLLRFRGSSDNTPANDTAVTSGTNPNSASFTPITSATSTTTPLTTSERAHDGRTETDSSNTTNTAAHNSFTSTTVAGGIPLMVPMVPQAMQYVLVNGMPYLVPAYYLPMLHYQQMQQSYGYFQFNADGTPIFPSQNGIHHNPIPDQPHAGAAMATDTPQQNPPEAAAREQRRAASLWLLMKLAFGIYLFGQNGSIERLVLLHIAAFIIFLHQTGRLRIVRRIVPTPPENGAQGAANVAPGAAVAPQPTVQTTTTSTTTTTTTTSISSSTEDSAAASSSSNQAQQATSSTSESSVSQQQQEGDAQGQDSTTVAAQPRLSPWRSLEHALLTFVTSLVPAPQPDIDPAVAAAAAAGERGM
ncbi:hypothetical protein FBU30_009680 [Linnemannia zychae]|nr:hypothetical protein FBU30_009680 [Linnemannia zychae]